MEILEKINGKLYQYNADNGDTYNLRYGDRGVLSRGKAWYFKVHHAGSEQHIATFTVKDDGSGCEKEDYGGRVWSGINEILPVANEMMEKMLPKENGKLQIILVNAMQLYAEEKIPQTDLGEKMFWKKYLEMLGTDLKELATLGVDIDELMEIHY